MERYSSSLKESTSSGLSSPAAIGSSVASPVSPSSIIEKRTSSWRYVQQSHSASSESWFQIVQVPRLQVDRHLAETLGSAKSTQKTRNLFVLGMSLGPILVVEGAQDLCRSVLRVMDEWEIWSENGLSGKTTGVSSGVKNLFRNQRVGRKSASSSMETANEQNSRATGFSNGQHGINGSRPSPSALVIINIPFALDYCQVVMALCDVIRQLYTRLRLLVIGSRDLRPLIPQESSQARDVEPSVTWPPILTDLFTKADQRLNKILQSIVRDMEQIAQAAVNRQLETVIRNLDAANGSSSVPHVPTPVA